MSVLIQGMEMPQNCNECIINCDVFTFIDKRSPNCPLIDIPIPHGDLVDLNDVVHPNDSMKRMTIDEQLGRTCEGWSAEKKEYIIIKAERQ